MSGLAAGTGSRLAPLTDDRPKCLIEFGGRTLLDRLAGRRVRAALLLVLRAGGSEIGWAFQLQEPGVVVALLVLAVAITANFAGLYERPDEEMFAIWRVAVEETRAGKLVDVQAPLNITSLGAFGIESATPIVVPPAMATLFIGTALYHSMLGVQVVIEDYVGSEGKKLAALLFSKFAHAAVAAAGIFAVLKIALA